MKKILARLLIAIITFTFASCKSTNSNENKNATTEPVTTTVTELELLKDFQEQASKERYYNLQVNGINCYNEDHFQYFCFEENINIEVIRSDDVLYAHLPNGKCSEDTKVLRTPGLYIYSFTIDKNNTLKSWQYGKEVSETSLSNGAKYIGYTFGGVVFQKDQTIWIYSEDGEFKKFDNIDYVIDVNYHYNSDFTKSLLVMTKGELKAVIGDELRDIHPYQYE